MAIGLFVGVNLYLLYPAARPSQPSRRSPAFSVVHANLGNDFQVRSARAGRFAADLTDRPHVELAVARDNVRFRLLSFHCSRPRNAKTSAIQAAEYEALAAWFQQSPSTHSVAIGDFNAAPWSQTVRHFLRGAALPTAQSGFSLAPTWPAGALGLIGVPIDLVTHGARDVPRVFRHRFPSG